MEQEATIYETLGWNQVNRENMDFFKAMGVDGISVRGMPVVTDDPSVAEDLKQMVSFVGSYGMKIYDVRWSVPDWSAVTCGTDGRDEQIRLCCNAIRVIGAARVPFAGYTFSAIGHFGPCSC